jgi:hypothetical protein
MQPRARGTRLALGSRTLPGFARCFRGRHNADGYWKPEFHHIINHHFDVIRAAVSNLTCPQTVTVVAFCAGVVQGELHLVFAQHRRLVRRDHADGFRELADAGGPTVEKAQLQSGHRQLRHPDDADDADENKIAGDFLPDILA